MNKPIHLITMMLDSVPMAACGAIGGRYKEFTQDALSVTCPACRGTEAWRKAMAEQQGGKREDDI